jgi:hypothetical protein
MINFAEEQKIRPSDGIRWLIAAALGKAKSSVPLPQPKPNEKNIHDGAE